MNIKYILEKDKVLVFDENEEIVRKKATENIDSIIIQENKIEMMEEQLEKNEKVIERAKEDIKIFKLRGLWLCPASLLMGIGVGTLFYVLCILYTIINGNFIVSDIFYDFDTIIKIMSLIGACFGVPLSLLSFSKSKSARKKLNVTNLESYFLENELITEHKKLQEMQKNDKCLVVEKEPAKPIYVDNQELQNKLKIYFYKLAKYGYKMKKYSKMYEKNPTNLALREELIADGINVQLFENYLEEYTRKLS